MVTVMAALAHHIATVPNVPKTPIVGMKASASAMKTGVEMTAQNTQVNVILFVTDVMDQDLKTVRCASKTLKTLAVIVNA